MKNKATVCGESFFVGQKLIIPRGYVGTFYYWGTY
jgi:hypothetical protein